MFDGKAFGAEIVSVVKDYVGRALDPLLRRLDALEARAASPGKDGQDGSDGLNGQDGAPGAPGKDGVGLAGMLIDRSGELVATMSDGSICPLGPVVGKNGDPGKSGRDGVDGLGFDDLTFEHDGERGFKLRFARGEQVKEFAFSIPVVLDRGVFQKEVAYDRGDAVTWGGSYWIAQKATSSIPGTDGDWRLAVKKGRDGKNGEPGKDARALKAAEGKS